MQTRTYYIMRTSMFNIIDKIMLRLHTNPTIWNAQNFFFVKIISPIIHL